jgi:hypothetical protein
MRRRREAAVALEDVLAVTRCAAALAQARAVEELTTAWLVRNRAREAFWRRMAAMPDHDGFGDGSLSAAAASLLRECGVRVPKLPDVRLLRAGAAVCAVLSDLAADPTEGAVRLGQTAAPWTNPPVERAP